MNLQKAIPASLLLALLVACAESPSPVRVAASPQPEAPPTMAPDCPGFPEGVDGGALLEAGLAEARATGRRVLVILGENSCPWCRALCELWWRPDVAAAAEKGFVVVKVDIGQGDRNGALRRRLGATEPVSPYLVVLDANEKIYHLQSSAGWEEPGGRVALVPEFLVDFLRAWSGPPAPPPPE
jgi:hypothetical protein